ncbi:hypothetical protein CMQ_39 [Grosmannia clavigera kw1407]|uniref:Methyltransferase n=1 Tax=Grosmannia clavigera (strain kw1407 / UAMH 11150) TaxID=655863 RepID=F0XQT0_GROCL|nr:uncharacterized protein CMQ_39 [Grosmannia clavigera kw1407]EFW99721.1 hypothetical protein CMQ_39 [Grosmannia clavigera kw1407]
MATTSSRRDVATLLKYYDDPGDGSPPAPVIVGRGTVKNERAMIEARTVVEDMTGREAAFTLDSCGFQLVHHASTATGCRDDCFRNESLIEAEYIGDCERLLQAVTGAVRVFVFEHKVRRGPADWHKLGPGNAAKRGPLHRAHVDQSYGGAEQLLRYYFPDEADGLLQRRYQIVNAWRPIKTIHKDPLGVADARSVPDDDLVEARVIYPDHEMCTWTIRPGPDIARGADPVPTTAHRWFYKHAQTPDEVMLIKCFDSIADGSVARRAAHSAFNDAGYDDAEPRESIEIRSFLFY